MVERIRTLLESRQLTPTQFADLIGVARPIISHILTGRNKPSLDVVQRILAALPDLSMAWLLNGTGPMLVSAALTTPAAGSAGVPAEPLPPHPEASTNSAPPQPPVPPRVIGTEQLPDRQGNALPVNKLGAPAPNKALPTTEPVANASAINRRVSRLAMPRRFPVQAPAGLRAEATTATTVPAEVLSPVPVPAPLAMPESTRLESTEKAVLAAEPAVPLATNPFALPTNSAAVGHAEPATEGKQPLPPPVATAPLPEPPVAAPNVQRAAPTLAGHMASALFTGAEKPIRRIVIFYRDGSFADYQPE